MTSLVRRQLDGLVRHLVNDVERLERPALPRGLLLDDAYFLLSVHGFGLGRRAARAVVRPARLQTHADAHVRVARQEADGARPVGVPSTTIPSTTRTVTDTRFERVTSEDALPLRQSVEGVETRTPPRYIGISESQGIATFSTMQQHWPWCLMHVEGHLTPIAQQHKPIWQQTSLSTKDSQHVRGGTPNLRQARWTQQRSSPLHEAPMHSGQSAYKLKLQQRHPLMRIRSDLCEEILGRSRRRGAAATAGARRHHFLRWF